MGNWTITIRGVGQHDNNLPADADAQALVFVQKLIASGQVVTDAYFTAGSGKELLKPISVQTSTTKEPI